MSPERIEEIVHLNGDGGGNLIGILEELQTEFGYLPQKALQVVSEVTGRSLVDIYGVATFYKSFSLQPRGEHLLSVCLGTACHVRGGPRIAEEFEKQLGIHPGETSKDNKFTFTTVNCLGACALGPVTVVDGRYYSKVKPQRVKEIIRETLSPKDEHLTGADKRVFQVEVSCSRCNHSLMDEEHLLDDLPTIRVTAAHGERHGWVRLSSLYGSFTVQEQYPAPSESVVDFFCPHCHTELLGRTDCPECGTLMIPLIVRGGGTVQICPKRGCRGHLLDLR